jgi:hypothetical protein
MMPTLEEVLPADRGHGIAGIEDKLGLSAVVIRGGETKLSRWMQIERLQLRAGKRPFVLVAPITAVLELAAGVFLAVPCSHHKDSHLGI